MTQDVNVSAADEKLDLATVAARLGRSTETLYGWHHKGKHGGLIRKSKHNGFLYVLESDLVEFEKDWMPGPRREAG